MNARPRLTKLDDLELRLEVTNLGTPYVRVIKILIHKRMGIDGEIFVCGCVYTQSETSNISVLTW